MYEGGSPNSELDTPTLVLDEQEYPFQARVSRKKGTSKLVATVVL
jgi:hypothetical protein